jgi:hypothetical protein
LSATGTHRFLRAIGFSKPLSQNEFGDIVEYIIENAVSLKKTTTEEGSTYAEIKGEIADAIGIILCGDYNDNDVLHLDHYFPYIENSIMTVNDKVSINKRVDTSAFTGMCDDMRVGLSLIFYLQNAIEYYAGRFKENEPYLARVYLAGLSLSGKVILGTANPQSDFSITGDEGLNKRGLMIQKAEMGDQNAMDWIIMNDIRNTEIVKKRLKSQDVYTVVDTSFYPYGSESDNYEIVGNIINWRLVKNRITGEEIYKLLLKAKDIIISICINKNDIMGVPAIGRRFKGNIWLQGRIDYYEEQRQ